MIYIVGILSLVNEIRDTVAILAIFSHLPRRGEEAGFPNGNPLMRPGSLLPGLPEFGSLGDIALNGEDQKR